MRSRVREKIALVVLAMLVLLAGFAIVAYFAFGRSWSVAATLMDDAVGRMNGYTALIISANDDELLTNQASDDPSSEAPERSTLSIRQSDVPADADTMGLRIMSYYTLANPDGIKAVDPQDVVDLYEEKDTNVAILDIADHGIGSDIDVIEADDKKVGIFYAAGYRSDRQIAKIVEKLHDKGAEAVLCITPRLATLQSTTGINAVLVLDVDDELVNGGVRNGDTLITALPSSGKVEVILLSSNNVATARVIDAL